MNVRCNPQSHGFVARWGEIYLDYGIWLTFAKKGIKITLLFVVVHRCFFVPNIFGQKREKTYVLNLAGKKSGALVFQYGFNHFQLVIPQVHYQAGLTVATPMPSRKNYNAAYPTFPFMNAVDICDHIKHAFSGL